MRGRVSPTERAVEIVLGVLRVRPDTPVVHVGDWMLVAAGIEAVQREVDAVHGPGRYRVRGAPYAEQPSR